MKASIVRRVERLEQQFKPFDTVELPPLDYDLLTESERDYFSKELVLLRTKARELGYGDKNNKVGWLGVKFYHKLHKFLARAIMMKSIKSRV